MPWVASYRSGRRSHRAKLRLPRPDARLGQAQKLSAASLPDDSVTRKSADQYGWGNPDRFSSAQIRTRRDPCQWAANALTSSVRRPGRSTIVASIACPPQSTQRAADTVSGCSSWLIGIGLSSGMCRTIAEATQCANVKFDRVHAMRTRCAHKYQLSVRH